MNNRICQILGIEKPVIQGPLSWLTDAKLVAAVSNAGGLGVLGPNAGLYEAESTPEGAAEKLREEIRKTKALTDKPFGVNVIVDGALSVWTPPQVEVIKQEKIPVVVYTGYGEGGIIPELFADLKSAGIKIVYRDINPTPENTRRAEQAGADVIVATGFDEGGTLPGQVMGTFSIVPLIVDAAQNVPVMAAGGITDHRTAKAAFALGAEGLFAGTIFCATEESRMHAVAKEKVVASTGQDLYLFRTEPDFYRSLPTKLADELLAMHEAGVSKEEINQKMGGLRGLKYGMLDGNLEDGYISVGNGIGSIHAIQSVQAVVDELTGWLA